MSQRINLGKVAPQMYQTVVTFDQQVSAAAEAAGIEAGFSHLLRLRVSQLNQCAFCIRMHTRDALECGESSDRISVLPAWRETDYFSYGERLALELVEAITLIAKDQVPDTVYQQAADYFSAEQLAALEWLAIVMNTWNRIAISSRYPVGA